MVVPGVFILNIIIALIDSVMLWGENLFLKAITAEKMCKDLSKNWISMDSSHYSGLLSTAQNICNLLIPIGCGLVIIFFLLELINQLAKDNLSSYTLIRSGIQLIFAYGIVIYGWNLCQMICGIGPWFIGKVTQSNGGISTNPTLQDFIIIPSVKVPESTDFGGIFNELTKNDFETPSTEGNILTIILSWIKALGQLFFGEAKELANNALLLILSLIAFVLMVIYWLAMKIIELVLILQCVSRAIQIAIYSALSPIGIAAWFSGGGITSSTAMRYVKKMVALSLQGGIMCLILQLATSFSAAANGNFLLLLLGPLTAVGLFSKSNQIANDVCGT